MNILNIIIDKDGSNVLMYKNPLNNRYDFIYGHTLEMETPSDASTRVLEEVTKLTKEDIKLNFMKNETISKYTGECSTTYISCGQLKKEYDVENIDNVKWVKMINPNPTIFKSIRGMGTYMYLQDAALFLRDREGGIIHVENCY